MNHMGTTATFSNLTRHSIQIHGIDALFLDDYYSLLGLPWSQPDMQ